MLHCKVCLRAGKNDIAPTRACVQRALSYLTFNIDLIKATLTYHDNEDGRGLDQEAQTYGHRKRLRSHVEILLRKRLSDQLPALGINVDEPIVCRNLLLDLIPAVHTPVLVKDYLAASDSRLRAQKQYLHKKENDSIPRYGLQLIEKKKAKMLRKQVDILELCITKVIESRSTAECSRFTALIHKHKLPREIREIIYDYLFEVGQVLTLRGNDAFWNKDEPTLPSPFDWGMNPDYVGEKIASEVEERYSLPRKILIEHENLVYQERLTSDPFCIDPNMFKRVRDLDLRHVSGDASLEFFLKLCGLYNQLDVISRKDMLSLLISFKFRTRYDNQAADHLLLNTLEVLRKPIHNLKHAGSRIRVRLIIQYPTSYRKEYYLINHGDWPHKSNVPSNDCFTLSGKAWEKKKTSGNLGEPSQHLVDPSMGLAEVRSRFIKRWSMSKTVREFVDRNHRHSEGTPYTGPWEEDIED